LYSLVWTFISIHGFVFFADEGHPWYKPINITRGKVHPQGAGVRRMVLASSSTRDIYDNHWHLPNIDVQYNLYKEIQYAI